MKIRSYEAGDYKEVTNLFHTTVHAICVNDYTAQELEAWAPTPINYEKWKLRLAKKKPFLAMVDNRIAGFAELETLEAEVGHIDCFYVHKDFQRRGIGTALLSHLERMAIQKGFKKIHAEVSMTAKSFFSKHGFKIKQKNIIDLNHQKLTNFLMEKELEQMSNASDIKKQTLDI